MNLTLDNDDVKVVGRQMHTNSAETIKPSVSGRGCVLVFAVRKL